MTKADWSNLDIEYVEPSRLSLHPHNPRQGDVGAIYMSIAAHGVYTPVVAQRSTGYIIVGNHRFRAMLEHGLDRIPVIWRDVDEETAIKIMLADNRASDLATNDDEQMVALLRALPDLEGTLFDGDDLDDLAASLEDRTAFLDDFEPDDDLETVNLRVAPEVAERWRQHRSGYVSDGDALGVLLLGR